MAPASHPVHSNTVAGLPRQATAARGCDSPPVPRQLHADPGLSTGDGRALLKCRTRWIHRRARTSAWIPAHGVEARQPSTTPKALPILADRKALQFHKQGVRFAPVMVGRVQKDLGLIRVSRRYHTATMHQLQMAHQFAELVAGGFEVQFVAPSFAGSRSSFQ